MLIVGLLCMVLGLWLGVACAIYVAGRIFILNWDFGFAMCWPLWLIVAIADR